MVVIISEKSRGQIIAWCWSNVEVGILWLETNVCKNSVTLSHYCIWNFGLNWPNLFCFCELQYRKKAAKNLMKNCSKVTRLRKFCSDLQKILLLWSRELAVKCHLLYLLQIINFFFVVFMILLWGAIISFQFPIFPTRCQGICSNIQNCNRNEGNFNAVPCASQSRTLPLDHRDLQFPAKKLLFFNWMQKETFGG